MIFEFLLGIMIGVEIMWGSKWKMIQNVGSIKVFSPNMKQRLKISLFLKNWNWNYLK